MPLYDETPVIHLEVRFLGQKIAGMLHDQSEELSKLVESEIEKVIDNFDFRAAIQDQVYTAVQESIKRTIQDYFKAYNEGGKAIHDQVFEILNRAVRSEE